ncbi:MAG TPA: helix-turn-helix transcriptional regulator [Pseudonocardiaceae bacterium]
MRRLGAELRRLREATGRNQTDVGEAIGRRHTTMVNWERGKTKISKSDLVCLLAELRAPVELREDLEKLRLEVNQATGQWSMYGLPACLKPLVSFEEDATSVVTFEPVVIPGLLQTEDYARTTHVVAPYVASADVVEKWVAARMQRQQRLVGPNPLKLHAIITEAVLRLEVGGPRVHKAQLERLLTDAAADNITIQVLPATMAAHVGIATNGTVIHFADPRVDRPLGYYDGPLGGNLVSHEGAVSDMINIINDLAQAAPNTDDSVAMIAAILKEIS